MQSTTITLVTSSDARKEAWINSRPTFDHSDLEDPAAVEKLTSMDLSMNSIAQYVFDITSSVKFRDFLLSIRPIAPWCRSLRSAPLTKEWLKICGPTSFERHEMDDIDECLAQIANGVPQDKARNILPMSLATTYTVAIDHRTLVSLLKSMQVVFPRMLLDQGAAFLEAIGKDVEWLDAQRIKPLHDAYIMTGKELRDAGDGRTEVVGEMIYSAFVTTYTHAAQLIRMHHAKVKTSIWTEAAAQGCLETGGHRQSDLVSVAVYADRSTWLNMLSLRSHWFAEWNSWSPVVESHLRGMSTEDFWNFIPNGGGRPDPYSRDMYSRISLEELNLPCPIMCEWPALVKARIQEQGANAIALNYEDLVTEGYIKNNPANIHRVTFINNMNAKLAEGATNPLHSRYCQLYDVLADANAI
jgi:hypothetical protein